MTDQNSKSGNIQRRFDPELLKKGLRCDLEQYKFLKECSKERAEGIKKWNERRKQNPDEDIFLEGAIFCKVNLEGVDLRWVHLEKADFALSHLESANFDMAHLHRTTFNFAFVNSTASFIGRNIDRKTDFREVSLNTIRVKQETKQLLEYNIRRMNWEKWYKEHPKFQWLVKPFWWMSDYGLSTKRVIFTFFGLALIFANIYYHWGRIAPPGIVDYLFVDRSGIEVQWWLVPLRTLYFSIVTMTTLGFGDMYANAHSIWGHILLSVQVILGYVLLGALVTRFAVLFTAGGPAGEFTDEKKKKDEAE